MQRSRPVSVHSNNTHTNIKMLFIYTKILTLLLIGILNSVECDDPPSILILGAGASGIAAASRLLENNITNLTVLEASNRIGGRIHSVEFENGVVDLGAQWCHGEKNNIVYELVKDLNLLQHDDIQKNFFYSTGEVLEKSFTDDLIKLFENIYYGEGEDNTTLGEYFTKRYTERVSELYKNDSKKLEIASNACHLFLHIITSNEGSFSAYNVSTRQDFTDSEGDLQLRWKKTGYKIILDVLMKKYPNPQNALPVMEKIEFNKEVVQITWNGDENFSKATVKCSDGSDYTADHVIVTFSLGVLKNVHKSLFKPALPIEKIQAIEELGIDAVSKILLHFPKRWWEASNYTDFNFVWSMDDRTSLLNSSTEEDNKRWLFDFLGLLQMKDHPHVLSAWFSGTSVPEIELFSDEKIIDGVMFVVNKFLGKVWNEITPPDFTIRHKWYSDPYFRGTYSYQTLESRTRNVSGEEALLQPLTSIDGKQTLMFAGEATHPHFYATVHGAIDSGRREADRIIRLYSS